MISRTMKLIAEGIRKNRRTLWDWQMEYVKKAPPPFYSSIDLRDSGHKIVPVDSNLYPGGFNNICPEDLRAAPPVLRAQIEAIAIQRCKPTGNKVLIIPEAHTSNVYYIENLYYLLQIVRNAGFETQIGWYGTSSSEHPEKPIHLVSQTRKELFAYPIKIQNGILSITDFVPDLILLNNDFSGGYPKLLDEVTQPIFPSHTLGWHSRKKSDHFRNYNRLAREFAQIIDIDPWLIQIDTEEVSPVNFDENQGTEEVAQVVDRVLSRTRQAYETHKVKRDPFVFVKNNSGTYGMGIMVVHSADDLRKLNRREKNKMSIGKNRRPIQSVVVQEGVPTATLVDRLAAEPVIYLFGGQLIGGFLRTNSEKTDEGNLNSQGMVFKKLCMSDLRNPFTDESPLEEYKEGAKGWEAGYNEADYPDNKDEPILELVYGSIARLSALASGMELADQVRQFN